MSLPNNNKNTLSKNPRRPRPANTRSGIFIYTILFSLLLHSPLLFLPERSSSPKRHTTVEEENIVFVDYPEHQQIVSQKNFNNIKPKKYSSYLSRENKRVEKETQAMLKGLFYQSEMPALSPQGGKSLPPTAHREVSSLILPQQGAEPIQMNIAEVTGGLSLGRNTSHRLSQTIDFLPRVAPGSHTLLNTKEFTYYSYFSRMNEQLYWRWVQYFRKEMPISLIKRNGKKSRQKLFSTGLYVHLSPQGEVQDIRITKSSGAEDIDSAALHAFLSAEPFPNPPKGLIEEDGYIHVKQNFHLYVGPSANDNLFSRNN